MAKPDRDLAATMLGGSDAIYDFYCEPCSTDGQHLEAAGFCKTCAVYMCSTCYNAHRKSPASRTHKLFDAATMPSKTITSKPRDVLTQPCDIHQDKTIEYVCNADGDLCCTVCLNMQHLSCNDRAYIPDISAGVASGKEYKDIATGMDGLVAMATVETVSIIYDHEDNDAYRTNAFANIQSGRAEIDKLLDDAEARTIQRVDELHKQNADKLNSASQKCQSVLADATTIACDLDDKAKTGKSNQLFVEVTMAGRRLPAMEEEINHLKARKISNFTVDKDNIVHHFKSTLSAMYSVTVTQDGTGSKARRVGDINIRSPYDSKDCDILDIAALSGDRVVVVDSKNDAVKLVSANLGKVMSHVTLSSLPLSVTKIDADRVAVAVGSEGKIEIFTVTDVLARTKTIIVYGTQFTSLCFDGNNFIVLDYQTRAVKKVDMAGKVISMVYTDSSSPPLFKQPRYITLDRDVMYITDWEADTVTCMTSRGSVIWVYKHAELKSTRGVAVGLRGDVLVCGGRSQTVQLLSRSGQLVQILLDNQRELVQFPCAIAICEDKLYVSSLSGAPQYRNYVRMYQLE